MSQKRCGFIALMGLPNAGKSSLLNALLGQKIAPVSYKPQTTRKSLRGILTKENNQLIFVDTPGMLEAKYQLQNYMQKQALTSANEVDVLVWVSDAPHILSKPSYHERDDEQVRQLIKRADGKPVVWVLNKVDLIDDKSLLLPLMEEKIKNYKFAGIIPLSAKKSDGLEELVNEISKNLPVQAFLFDPEMITDAFERNLVEDIIREKVLTELGDEVPHQVAITIDEFDESRRDDKKKPLVEIHAVLHVERESQKKIVIGKNGDKIKQIGMKARKEIELLLQCQVMLHLVVRLESDWTNSPKSLKKLGYF